MTNAENCIYDILLDADVLFLDESTSNLDEETKSLVFDLLLNTNLTIVNSTHDIDSFKTLRITIFFNFLG